MLAIIFVILVLTAIGYTFSAMMASKQRSVPATLEAGKAFHIAEGGLHHAGKYLSTLLTFASATPYNQNMGGGQFNITFTPIAVFPASPERITVTSTGTYGSGQRIVVATFER